MWLNSLIFNLLLGSSLWLVAASCTLTATVESTGAFQKLWRATVGSQLPFLCICKRQYEFNVQTMQPCLLVLREVAAAGVEADI